MLSQRWNHFLVCSASDEMHSAYAQRVLNDVLKWVVISSYAEHAWKLVTLWLSIGGNCYSFSEHMRKSYVSCLKCLFLVSHPLFPVSLLFSLFPALCLPSSVPCLTSLFLVSRPLFHVPLLCSLSPVLCSMSHFFVPCLPSSVPCLTSLFLVSRPLFPVSLLCSLFPALCLPFSVPCLTSLSLVSRPLFHVSLLSSLSPVLCSQSHFSVPCFLPFVPCFTCLFPVSHPLFHVSLLSSLSPVLCSMSHFFVPCLPSSVPNLTFLFLVSRSLSPILSLCSLYPILLSRRFVALYLFHVSSACDEISSEYAQCAMKSFPRMLSMQWIPSAYAQLAMKSSPRMLSMLLDVHVQTVEIWTLAEHTRKFIRRMLSVRWNSFLVSSVCDTNVSTNAQYAHAIIFENYPKIPN